MEGLTGWWRDRVPARWKREDEETGSGAATPGSGDDGGGDGGYGKGGAKGIL